ncbi:UDP-N-acetylmuramoylalanine--D-glutamate ligase [Methanosarcinaceae archaeon Ag5]|uniref:UDP-N-acetylmuramoylalanine--D-glutamate ligase n=1 Tax=Methanolapillus africanus TaxID=3028297 RepID=A0AAE4MKQ9_9EURY|nr:UDP-N-acetylmuramoylalanine--D-glutamate ligase [Methanosarcinaceae archaeon Ag5]
MENSEIPWTKIAVFDLNHGGLAIASQLLKKGVQLTAFDIYKKMSDEKIKKATEDYGFSVSNNLADLDADEPFELVCLPIHVDSQNEFVQKAIELNLPTMTHHDIVGRMLHGDKRLEGKKLIEFTGTRGKTSACTLFAQMLSYKKCIGLHTSKGISVWKNGQFKMIREGVSISPAYVPDIIDFIFDSGYDPETFVFEISLGSTGAEDVGVLTTLEPEYMVSGKSLTSTEVKTQIFTRAKENGTFIVNYNDWEKIKNYIRKDQEVIVFDASGKAVEDGQPTDVFLNISKGKDGKKTAEIESSRNSKFFSVDLSDDYDPESYKTAFAASISAALEFDVTESQIADVLEHFNGITGRMKETEEEGRRVIDNSNSGLDIYSCEWAIKYMLEKYFDKKSPYYDTAAKRELIVVIGEEGRTVCDGIEPFAIDKLVEYYKKDIDKLILVGDRLKNYMGDKCSRNVDAEEAGNVEPPVEAGENGDVCTSLYADDFKSGFMKALDVSKEGDIIVMAVKSFR